MNSILAMIVDFDREKNPIPINISNKIGNKHARGQLTPSIWPFLYVVLIANFKSETTQVWRKNGVLSSSGLLLTFWW